jgi:hypothetical protein
MILIQSHTFSHVGNPPTIDQFLPLITKLSLPESFPLKILCAFRFLHPIYRPVFCIIYFTFLTKRYLVSGTNFSLTSLLLIIVLFILDEQRRGGGGSYMFIQMVYNRFLLIHQLNHSHQTTLAVIAKLKLILTYFTL